LKVIVYRDEMSQTDMPLPAPENSTLLDGIIRDSVKLFADNINTTEKENIADGQADGIPF